MTLVIAPEPASMMLPSVVGVPIVETRVAT